MATVHMQSSSQNLEGGGGGMALSSRRQMLLSASRQQLLVRQKLREMGRQPTLVPSSKSSEEDYDPHPRPWGSNRKAYASRTAHQCAVCKLNLLDKHGNLAPRVTTPEGATYHIECFKCSACSCRLRQDADSASEAGDALQHECGVAECHYMLGGHLLCPECYRERHGKQCTLCSAKLLRWASYGGQVCCLSHNAESLRSCVYCSVLLPVGTSGVTMLEDGQRACERCTATALSDTAQIRKLYERVRAFFSRELGILLPQTLQGLRLADRVCSNGPPSATPSGGRCLLGLTCTEQLVDPSTNRVVPGSRRVTSVALLRGLPEDLALTVLAHEAGHVYLHLQQYETHSMASRVEEGLCELFAYLWEHGRCVAGDVDWARRERMRQMETNTNAVYGDGLRDALAGYVSCGFSLQRLLARVKATGGELPRAGGPMMAAWTHRPGRSFQALGGAATADAAVYQPVGEDTRRVDTRRRAKVFDERRRRAAQAESAARDLSELAQA